MHGIARHHGKQPRKDGGDGENPEEDCFAADRDRIIADCRLPIADLGHFISISDCRLRLWRADLAAEMRDLRHDRSVRLPQSSNGCN